MSSATLVLLIEKIIIIVFLPSELCLCMEDFKVFSSMMSCHSHLVSMSKMFHLGE